MKGQMIGGRYRIIEKIGEGGMAQVLKADCEMLGRTVALKILKKEFEEDDDFLEKFKNEARAAASLNHPNIVNIYDVGIEQSMPYIVMEYIEGLNLKELIKSRGPLEERQALGIIRQIAAALQAAHDKNIVHRDIKPHNILITPQGLVKVADFGISKAVSASTLTSTGNVMGSVHYFSPEQARGGYIDHRSDLYSLGIVLYELLCGKVPFSGETPVNVALKHIHDKVNLPEEVKSHLSEGTVRILAKMTQKSLDKRYRSAQDLIEDIDQVLGNPHLGHVLSAAPFAQDKAPLPDSLAFDTQTEQETQDSVTSAHDFSGVYGDEDEFDENTPDATTQVVRRPAYYQEEIHSKEVTAPVRDRKSSSKTTGTSKPRKRRRKRFPVIAVFCGLIAALLLLLSLALGGFSLPGIGTPKTVMPTLTGLSFEQAQQRAKEVGIELTKEEQVTDKTYSEGEVMRQDPEQGQRIKKGQKATVVIAKREDSTRTASPSQAEERQVAVPDIKGKSVEQAEEELLALGLDSSLKTQETADAAENTVLAQNPSPGIFLQKGEMVILTVSKPPAKKEPQPEPQTPVKEQLRVPDLTGKTRQEAEKVLGNFSLGEVSFNEKEDRKDGVILSQNPKPSAKAEKGTPIHIVINKRPEKSTPESVEDKKVKLVRRWLAIALPEQEKVTVKVVEIGTGAVIFEKTVKPADSNGVLTVEINGQPGQTKKFQTFIDGTEYTTSEDFTF